jgi:hypothetical protein
MRNARGPPWFDLLYLLLIQPDCHCSRFFVCPEKDATRSFPSLSSPERRLEVQIHPHGGQPWHLALAFYLKSEEEGSRIQK